MFTLDAWNETFIVFSNNLTSFKSHLHVHTRCLEDQISLHFYKLEIFSSLALKREKSTYGDLWRILVHSLLVGMNQPSSMNFIKKEKNKANFIKAYFFNIQPIQIYFYLCSTSLSMQCFQNSSSCFAEHQIQIHQILSCTLSDNVCPSFSHLKLKLAQPTRFLDY